nr:MAG TPA: hypothetical protein [Caudoviricetes sp.]
MVLPGRAALIDLTIVLRYCIYIQSFGVTIFVTMDSPYHLDEVMALDRKPVTIHYRKYVPTNDGRRNSLEHMIRTAMNVRRDGSRVRDRVALRVRTNGSDNFLVNTYVDTTDGGDLAFGDIIHFTRGQMQAVLHLAEDDPAVLPVRQMPAPARSEYVHSQMFWMVKNDHVFVIQSISLQTEALEGYLQWLLQDLLPPDETNIVLAAKFDSTVVGGDLDDIKEIVIGGAISGANAADQGVAEDSQVVTREREITQTSGLVSEGRTGRALAREILETLMNGDSNVADEVLQAVPPDAELLVQVHIGYKTRKRRVDRTSLRHLEAGLRHIPDSQLSVVAKGVNKSADGSIRLNHTASVKLIKSAAGDSEIVGSLLDPTDVLRAMVQAYSVLSADGKIG